MEKRWLNDRRRGGSLVKKRWLNGGEEVTQWWRSGFMVWRRGGSRVEKSGSMVRNRLLNGWRIYGSMLEKRWLNGRRRSGPMVVHLLHNSSPGFESGFSLSPQKTLSTLGRLIPGRHSTMSWSRRGGRGTK